MIYIGELIQGNCSWQGNNYCTKQKSEGNDMEKNKGVVVSVGAGTLQYDFIERLKNRGYVVAAFGKGKNSKEAIRLCDFFKEIDTADADGAINWLDGLNMSITAIGSYAGGVAIRTLQILANYYNLITAIPEQLIIGMNKAEQQRMYVKYGLSDILTYSCDEITRDSNLLHAEENYIIKPAIGRGSNGVEIVTGKEIIKKLGDKQLGSGDIIQTMMCGTEYRMLLMVQGGKIKLLAPVRRTSFKKTFFLGRLEVSFSDYDRLREHAQKLIEKLQIRNTIIKYDVIVDDETINLIEMDIGVGGGVYFKKYISKVLNTDLMEKYIDLICDREIPEMKFEKKNLVMDYVYNESCFPVEYDLLNCKKKIEKICGKSVLIPNELHPEKKGGFYSNADFIFTVIYDRNGSEPDKLNDYVNYNLLRKC